MLMPHELLSAFRYFIMEIFYHRICQQLVAHLTDTTFRGLSRTSVYIELDKLADPYILNLFVAQRMQRLLDSFALRIEHTVL